MAAFFDAYDEKGLLTDVLKDQAEDKAKFCLATGVQPSEYDKLTQYEINAFVTEANKRAKKGNG